MGLNRMMMGKGEVKVEDGSKDWSYAEAGNKQFLLLFHRGLKESKWLQ